MRAGSQCSMPASLPATLIALRTYTEMMFIRSKLGLNKNINLHCLPWQESTNDMTFRLPNWISRYEYHLPFTFKKAAAT